LFEFPHVPAA